MTAQSSIPLKWYVPFAQGDSSRVELPVTTSDPTRASQTLGFPPLTMQPPESGGVPPQGEDFNGGLNQVARIAWWVMNGGGWPYDATFASNSNINGYPNGATVQAADFRGNWINTADNNQNNPDTNGTNWVPGFQYGATAITGLTGGTVTPTPAQAAKNAITLAGTLTSALTIVLPNWTKNWTITNNTTGAFVTIVKTAAGSGVTIPQNAAATRVSGDGTNITQSAENIANAASSTQAAQFGQVPGVIGAQRGLSAASAGSVTTVTWTAVNVTLRTAVAGLVYSIASFNASVNLTSSGNGGVVGVAPAANGFAAIYAMLNPTTGTGGIFATDASSAAAPDFYAGALPSGFTACALIGIVPISGTATQFAQFQQVDRSVAWPGGNLVSGSTFTGGPALTGASTLIPYNAKVIGGFIQPANSNVSSAGALSCTLSPLNIAAGGWVFASTVAASSSNAAGYRCGISAANPRQVYRTVTATGGTLSHTITTDYYEF